MLETQFALPPAKRKKKKRAEQPFSFPSAPPKKSVISRREEKFSAKRRRKRRLLKLGVEIVRFVSQSFLEALSPPSFPPTIREIYTLLPLNRNKPASFQGKGEEEAGFLLFLCPFGQSLRACLNTLVAEQRPTLDPPPSLVITHNLERIKTQSPPNFLFFVCRQKKRRSKILPNVHVYAFFPQASLGELKKYSDATAKWVQQIRSFVTNEFPRK